MIAMLVRIFWKQQSIVSIASNRNRNLWKLFKRTIIVIIIFYYHRFYYNYESYFFLFFFPLLITVFIPKGLH